MPSIGKAIRRYERRTTRGYRRQESAQERARALAASVPELRENAAVQAADLRARAAASPNVRRAIGLNRRAGDIELALRSESSVGSPRVAALRELARAANAPQRAEAAREQYLRNARTLTALERSAVSGSYNPGRSRPGGGTGLKLGLRPSQRDALREAAAGGTNALNDFLATLRLGQQRRFSTLTTPGGLRNGTIQSAPFGARGAIARGIVNQAQQADRRPGGIAYVAPRPEDTGI